MKKGQACNANFFNRWLNYKIEKLREIERLCSAIMNVLEIAEGPSNGIARLDIVEGETVNRDYAGVPPSLKDIDWGKAFDKLARGEKIIYRGFRHWYAMNREGGTCVRRLFYNGQPGDLDKEGLDHPLWIQIPPYGENIASFQNIRNDCKILSQLLKYVDATYDGQDFKAIEDTVNGVIQGAFTLIGIHDKEHQITAKLREYEVREQERIKADEVMQKARKKGGEAPKINAAILEAVKEFIMENQKRIGQPAATIARSFKRKYDSSQPLEITVDSIKYDVYCDGQKVFSSCPMGNINKYHAKSIAYSTFTVRYITEAKRMLESSKSSKK
jgi:hypothetical protein